MAQKVITTQEVTDDTAKTKAPYNKATVTDVYLKTNTGVIMLVGKDGDKVREQVEQDKKHTLLDYRFFDDDRRLWAYWAVQDVNGDIKPLVFPDLNDYSLTSPQLYTKARTYTTILAHAVGLLKQKPPSWWDRMMKPTTIILAIVAIVFVMGLMLMALQG